MKSQCDRILDVLADGREHSHHEFYGWCVLHSRVAELRKRGHRIEQRRDGDLYLYRLVTVHPEREVLASGSAEMLTTGELDGRGRPVGVAYITETSAPECSGDGSTPSGVNSQGSAVEASAEAAPVRDLAVSSSAFENGHTATGELERAPHLLIDGQMALEVA